MNKYKYRLVVTLLSAICVYGSYIGSILIGKWFFDQGTPRALMGGVYTSLFLLLCFASIRLIVGFIYRRHGIENERWNSGYTISGNSIIQNSDSVYSSATAGYFFLGYVVVGLVIYLRFHLSDIFQMLGADKILGAIIVSLFYIFSWPFL